MPEPELELAEIEQRCLRAQVDQGGTLSFNALLESARDVPALCVEVRRLRDALEAVLMFHSAGPWGGQQQMKWDRLTGCAEPTTKGLCDVVRNALEPTAPPTAPPGGQEEGP